MSGNKTPFRSASTIKCCHYCVAPKRHTACWGHCPEYLKEKEANEARKAKERVRKGLDAQVYDYINRTQKKGN